MLILAPPSEGKTSVNSTKTLFRDTEYIFNEQVHNILDKLSNLDDVDIQKVYGTSLDKSKSIHSQNLNIYDSRCSLAIERYTGVVFKYLDWKSLNENEQIYLTKHLRIISGLFGILRPDNLIPNYKLKIEVLSLAQLWKTEISNHIKTEDLILDLLPAAHRKALEPTENAVKINFMIEKNGKLTQSAHAGKVVKGKFIKYLAKNQIQNIDGIQYFKDDGYIWDGHYFIKRES